MLNARDDKVFGPVTGSRRGSVVFVSANVLHAACKWSLTANPNSSSTEFDECYTVTARTHTYIFATIAFDGGHSCRSAARIFCVASQKLALRDSQRNCSVYHLSVSRTFRSSGGGPFCEHENFYSRTTLRHVLNSRRVPLLDVRCLQTAMQASRAFRPISS